MAEKMLKLNQPRGVVGGLAPGGHDQLTQTNRQAEAEAKLKQALSQDRL